MQSPAPREVIIVESDSDLRRGLLKHLSIAGYEVIAVGSALEFYRLIDHYTCRLAIMDIGLPDQSGLVLVEYLKKNTDIYVVMLTTSDSVEERIGYYRAGADALLVKPVDFREITALIGNVFDRIDKNGELINFDEKSINSKLSDGHVSADESLSWRLSSDGWRLISPAEGSIELTLREFKFLVILSRSPDIAVSRSDLLMALDYRNDEYGNRALESLVHRLRGKMNAFGSSPIKTAHGVGYSFTAPVKVL